MTCRLASARPFAGDPGAAVHDRGCRGLESGESNPRAHLRHLGLFRPSLLALPSDQQDCLLGPERIERLVASGSPVTAARTASSIAYHEHASNYVWNSSFLDLDAVTDAQFQPKTAFDEARVHDAHAMNDHVFGTRPTTPEGRE